MVPGLNGSPETGPKFRHSRRIQRRAARRAFERHHLRRAFGERLLLADELLITG
jgi:hypothetical protein